MIKKDNVLKKYSRDSSLVGEIIDETEMFIYKRDIFCISIIKPLKHFNWFNHYNNLIKSL